MTPQELRSRAAGLLAKIKAAADIAEGENRELTEEETGLITGWQAEITSLEKRAKTIEAIDAQVVAASQTEPRTSKPLSGNGEGVECTTVQSVRGQSEGDKTRYFGDMLRTIMIVKDSNVDHRTKQQAHERLSNLYDSQYRSWDTPEKRTLSATTGSAGGHTIPPDFLMRLMQVVGENAIVRPRATIIPMNGLSIKVPLLNQTDAPPTGGTAFLAGMVGSWTGETESKADTNPSFKQADLQAHELSASTKVSRVLLQTSAFSIDALLFSLFGRLVAWMEDQAFFLGASPQRPKGIIPSGALVQTADRGSSTAISFANIAAVFVKMVASSQGNAVFVASQSAQPAVLAATGTSGSVFVPAGLVPITPDGVRNSGFNIGAFARPILFSEKLPALDTLGDFGMYDFSQYLIGDPSMSMEIATSEHESFLSNLITFRLVHYVAGMPWMDAPFTLADGTLKVSPFVGLAIH